MNPSLTADFFKTPRVFLAPMEGVVDAITRDILTSIGGIDVTVTEFIRVIDQELPDHVFFRDAPELESGSQTPSGTPLLVQLLGSDPEMLGRNAARAVRLGARGIDLNFGCPAKTVNRHDGGATLLKNPERVYAAIKGVRSAVPDTHSVSAKVRLGFSDTSLHREIAIATLEAGASWLTIHARTRDDGYKPPAHWELIASMNDAIGRKIPVIANGECWTPDDTRRMREISSTEHIMLGRGLLARPSLALESRGQGELLAWERLFPLIQKFVADSNRSKSARFAAARLKQWLKSLLKTYPEAGELFSKIKTLETIEALT